jgi:UDP-N-acetylmuramoyl-tripeptide--D-alanyl-D-alanine ligase
VIRPLWTAEAVAAATGGTATGDWSVAGVSIDSRTVQPGELFIALVGPNHDGHAFVDAALQRGAAALVHRRPAGLPPQTPLVLVDDTMQALRALARAGRARSRARILAVTGSVGKTGVKEALRHVLASQADVHASVASFNNHWGVPLSLARMPESSVYGIFELGMNASGEIAPLSRLVRPDVALITAIAPAHLGFFRSIEEIADAKAEIFAGLEQDGTAVLDGDSPHFPGLANHARAAGCRRVWRFGEGTDAEIRLLDAACEVDGSDLSVSLFGRRLAFRIGSPGPHWVRNALAVLLSVTALGADPALAAAGLRTFQPPAGRGARHDLPWPGGRLVLVDDSYNANPSSMAAAFAVLAGAPGRKIAVLGDMLELGPDERELHAGLAPPLLASGVDLVFTVGPLMEALQDALPAERRGAHAAAAGDLPAILAAALRPGDTVLVKGSLGSRMGQIVDALKRPAGAGDSEGS